MELARACIGRFGYDVDYFSPRLNGWAWRVVCCRIGLLPQLPYIYIGLYLGCIVLSFTYRYKDI
jgi:hypothetical protein